MKSSPITGALVVCVAAAGIAVGALVLEPGGSPAPAAGGAAPAPTAAPAGGGYGTPAGGTGGGAAPAGGSLEISGFQFGAASVGAGGQVTVSNRDGAPHTVTSDDGAFDSGQVGGGSTGAFVAPGQPGTYSFHCEIHPDMSGTLTVG
jgi:plastocyanin